MPPKKKMRRTTTNTPMYIHEHTGTPPGVHMYDSNRSAIVHFSTAEQAARRERIIQSGNASTIETAEEPTDATMVAQELP